MINAYVVDIDTTIARQLRRAAPIKALQKLASSRRGLCYLITNAATSGDLRLRLFNVSKLQLADDLRPVTAFDQSVFYKKVYEDDYGLFGGEPSVVLLGDDACSHALCDVDLAEGIAHIAAVAHISCISMASPAMLGMSDGTQLDGFPDLGSLFQRSIYISWRSFCEEERARSIHLALPYFLLRLPYSYTSYPTDACNFDEDVDGTDYRHALGGNTTRSLHQRLNAMEEPTFIAVQLLRCVKCSAVG